MTREEIMQLNTDYLNGCESEHKMNELFSYALSQEPCDDAVSRQKALLSLTGEDLPKDRDKYIALVNERIKALPPVRPQEPKTEQWQELKETITEMRDNNGTGTQQEACKFLVNYMEVLEKQLQEPKICEKCLYAEETDGSHCYECVKGESKFEPLERSDKE